MVFGSQDSDSKFSHLLLPIRDLTKNWNIDLAGDLEDYLDEVGQYSSVNPKTFNRDCSGFKFVILVRKNEKLNTCNFHLFKLWPVDC